MGIAFPCPMSQQRKQTQSGRVMGPGLPPPAVSPSTALGDSVEVDVEYLRPGSGPGTYRSSGEQQGEEGSKLLCGVQESPEWDGVLP